MEGDGKTFTIDPRSGELSLLRTVDREAEELFRCDREKIENLLKKTLTLYSIRLTVRADDGVHQSDINVLITVRYLLYKATDIIVKQLNEMMMWKTFTSLLK